MSVFRLRSWASSTRIALYLLLAGVKGSTRADGREHMAMRRKRDRCVRRAAVARTHGGVGGWVSVCVCVCVCGRGGLHAERKTMPENERMPPHVPEKKVVLQLTQQDAVGHELDGGVPAHALVVPHLLFFWGGGGQGERGSGTRLKLARRGRSPPRRARALQLSKQRTW